MLEEPEMFEAELVRRFLDELAVGLPAPGSNVAVKLGAET